ISSKGEVRNSIDPSFKTYEATSTINDISASSKFFDDSALPLLWLNPTSTITDPFADWRSLESLDWDYRGLNYRYLPVSSGLGTSVLYPTVTSGWTNQWGTEYTSMPELENSLIYYGSDNSYNSGFLSEKLTGKEYSRNDLIEDEFDGIFNGNYVDGVWMSNPVISESYDFAEIASNYYTNVYDITNPSGLYNFYDPAGGTNNQQMVLAKNTLEDYVIINSATGNHISSSMTTPIGESVLKSFTDSSLTVKEVDYALSAWDQYVSILMDTQGLNYGLELTQKLPLIDRKGVDSIQIAFDASIIASSFSGGQYKLSVQIRNFDQLRWESIPMMPTTTGGYYDANKLNLEFWDWQDSSPSIDAFRPRWGSYDENQINTISYGETFPHTITLGDFDFDSSIKNGANFLMNESGNNNNFNSYWGEDKQNLFYDSSYNSNKFQISSLIINPRDFYTTSTANYPVPLSGTLFENFYSLYDTSHLPTEEDFFENFVDNNGQFKIRLITNKEWSTPSQARLSIGDFKTYTLTDSNYLNFNNFDSNIITHDGISQPVSNREISDWIDFTSTGLELGGDSGFNLRSTPQTYKFRESFNDPINRYWDLDPGILDTVIEYTALPSDDAFVNYNQPNTNYGYLDYLSFKTTTPVWDPLWLDSNMPFLRQGAFPFLLDGYSQDSTLSLYMYSLINPGGLDLDPLEIGAEFNFNEDTITWANRPQPTIATLSSTVANLGWNVYPIGAPAALSYGIDNPFTYNTNMVEILFYSKEYSSSGYRPYFSHYISKNFHGNGNVYMQTDETELLEIGHTYDSTTYLQSGDTISIQLRTTTSNQIKLKLLNDDVFEYEFEIIPQGNSNYDAQIINIPYNGADIQFNQLSIYGTLDYSDYVLVDDILIADTTEIFQVNPGFQNYQFIESSNPVFPLINFGSTRSGSSINMAHNEDGINWIVDSQEESPNSHSIEIDFLFEQILNFQELSDIEIQIIASSSEPLGSNLLFECWDYSINDFVPISYMIVGNLISISISSADFISLLNSNGEILLKIRKTNSSSFDVSIDSIYAEGRKDWNVVHDLYSTSFEFTLNRDVPNSNDAISFLLNDQVFINIQDDDSQLNSGSANTVSFYYDTSTQEWDGFLNSNLRFNLYDPSPKTTKPRVETYYSDVSEGIELSSIKSQYFIKVNDKYDFNKYKLLVEAYNNGNPMYSYQIDSLDGSVVPENTFTQVSSDIDIIYSFNDNMNPLNIYNYNLNPSYKFNDQIDGYSGPYSYEEVSLITGDTSGLDYSYVTGHSGSGYGAPSPLSYLNDIGQNYYIVNQLAEPGEIFFDFDNYGQDVYLLAKARHTLNYPGSDDLRKDGSRWLGIIKDAPEWTEKSEFAENINSVSYWWAFIIEFLPGYYGEIDYLYSYQVNKYLPIPVFNDVNINVDTSLFKADSASTDTGIVVNGEYFSQNTVKFTLSNSITAPVFGRESELMYTTLELDDLDFTFDLVPQTDVNLLEHDYIEGKDYDIQTLEYSTHRFKNSFIDDAHIPLITPIELDFGQINTQSLTNVDLELTLDLDTSLDYRSLTSPDWELRSRLMMYNYTSQQWKDFSGIITATNDGGQTFTNIWQIDPTYQNKSNLYYLQYPNTHQ
ncbi:hypothetical protein LCGC14_1306980, partial [marine sediment metagenome]